ncbi:hypothetical protein A0J61_11945, partial [Choanephora cucurbitarum]
QNQRIGFYLNNEQQLQNVEDKYIIINVDQLLTKATYINYQNRNYYIRDSSAITRSNLGNFGQIY